MQLNYREIVKRIITSC